MFLEKRLTNFFGKSGCPKPIIPARDTQLQYSSSRIQTEVQPSTPTWYIQEAQRETQSSLRHWNVVWKRWGFPFLHGESCSAPRLGVLRASQQDSWKITAPLPCRTQPVNISFSVLLSSSSCSTEQTQRQGLHMGWSCSAWGQPKRRNWSILEIVPASSALARVNCPLSPFGLTKHRLYNLKR